MKTRAQSNTDLILRELILHLLTPLLTALFFLFYFLWPQFASDSLFGDAVPEAREAPALEAQPAGHSGVDAVCCPPRCAGCSSDTFSERCQESKTLRAH